MYVDTLLVLLWICACFQIVHVIAFLHGCLANWATTAACNAHQHMHVSAQGVMFGMHMLFSALTYAFQPRLLVQAATPQQCAAGCMHVYACIRHCCMHCSCIPTGCHGALLLNCCMSHHQSSHANALRFLPCRLLVEMAPMQDVIACMCWC